MPLSYLGFLLVFVFPPLVASILVAFRRDRDRRFDRTYRAGVPLLVVLALAYTIPWDNHLVAKGVWTYADGSVLLSLPHAPVEEYLFVACQTVVVGLWTERLDWPGGPVGTTRRARLAGGLAGGLVSLVGFAFLLRESTFYLGAILTWSGPVLLLQWGFGWSYLWRARRRVALGVLVPAAYFAIIDRIAIEAGIWSLASSYTTGLAVLGLPAEEALFFLLTTLFVVQGLVLFERVMAEWR